MPSEKAAALITNDAVVLGLLAVILAGVFWASSLPNKGVQRFFAFVPALLLCYFLPSLLTTFGVVDPETSRLYFIASRFLLPAALVLLTVSADLPAVFRLGPKALIMFFTGTLGVMLGGPIALLLTSWVAPDLMGAGPEAIWRGMATVAGSWIGGSANQTALYEIYGAGPDVFSIWIAVDVIVANIWMAGVLWIAANQVRVNRLLRADASAVDRVREKAEAYETENARIPSLKDLIFIVGVGFGAVGLSHALADPLSAWFGANAPWAQRLSLDSSFFWLVLIATVIGVVLSFTPARKLQGPGAAKVGSVFVYVLVATVGLNMNIGAILDSPAYFLIGLVWMAVHVLLLFAVAWLIKAPAFFLGVGSMANIGGAASAPVAAAAFHPSLASVGVLLAVVGYIVGTGAAWFTGLVMMQIAGAG
ncbi:putative membrane protein [Brevundimonas bullata]|jgi:uncharacterized membrane protein|uniref:Putative membrane protein n=1 Tax=Brevundimonas bullata TaxID=13160 RepID=A0A7W7N3I2_9CAUL|nr:DUF819 family protein [Brevundimonas bullata]MBB4798423.1 putative membrane protein [Brevundimonas bullata]MBB6383263.1 putative membrane protein [Brevundimonas bullata]